MKKNGSGAMLIYKITNKINGKVYIGQTARSLERRWKEHCCPKDGSPLLRSAIQKYGKENFTVEQIDCAADRPEANAKECYWIAFYESADKEKGYNLSLGGEIGHFNEETLKKMSDAHMGAKNYFYGKHHTEECKKRMRNLKVGLYTGENHPKARKVRCIETGEVFNTIKEAEEKYKISHGKISDVCSKKYGRKTAGGMRWEYE
jgi:group I intron endonuclease